MQRKGFEGFVEIILAFGGVHNDMVLVIDVIWLSFATKSFYRPLIGDLLTEKPGLWAAALFYLLYVAGMSFIVIQPCIHDSSVVKSLYIGFVFGLVAYGTYNLAPGPFRLEVHTIWHRSCEFAVNIAKSLSAILTSRGGNSSKPP